MKIRMNKMTLNSTRVFAVVLSVVLIQSVCAQEQSEYTQEAQESLADLSATSNPRIHSGYEENLRFHQFETFNFSSPTEIDDPVFSEFLILQYSAGIEGQMLNRGFTLSDQPDILINVSIDDLQNKTTAPKRAKQSTTLYYSRRNSMTSCPSFGDFNAQVGKRRYSSSGSLPSLCSFKEGSVKVDMMVVELNRAIWSGDRLVRIDNDEAERNMVDQRNLLGYITNDVNIMFENFPFRLHQEIEGLPKDS